VIVRPIPDDVVGRYDMRRAVIAIIAIVGLVLPQSAEAGIRPGEIGRVSLGTDGEQIEGSVGFLGMSHDGLRVVYSGVLMRDVQTGVTLPVSLLPDGSPADAPIVVGVSDDGERVMFATLSESRWQLFLRDVMGGSTVELTPDVPLAIDDPLPEPPIPGLGVIPWVYQFDAFDDLETIEVRREAVAVEVLMGPRSSYGIGEVYRFDVATGSRTIADCYSWSSVVEWVTTPIVTTTTVLDSHPYLGERSRDGRWSVFCSDVAESADDPDADRSCFLHDFDTGTTRWIASQAGDQYVWGPVLVSDDGQRVVLNRPAGPILWQSGMSMALTDVEPGSIVESGDAALERLGLISEGLGYLYEVSSTNLVLVSRSVFGELPDIRNTRIKVSADGSVAVIGSSATNLVPGDTNNATGPNPYSVEAGFDLFVVPIETLTFDDITDSLFVDDITWLAGEGITRGCNPSGTHFCPVDLVTRAQMAAFLSRALELPTPLEGDRFVDDEGIFESDIETLAAVGITRGCNADGTKFCPDDAVTRGEMAAFLARALGLAVPAGSDRFVDDDGIFEADIEAIAAAEITRGCAPDGTRFCPDEPVTREQMAAFLHRALQSE
jgi:hypothetical protein